MSWHCFTLFAFCKCRTPALLLPVSIVHHHNTRWLTEYSLVFSPLCSCPSSSPSYLSSGCLQSQLLRVAFFSLTLSDPVCCFSVFHIKIVHLNLSLSWLILLTTIPSSSLHVNFHEWWKFNLFDSWVVFHCIVNILSTVELLL